MRPSLLRNRGTWYEQWGEGRGRLVYHMARLTRHKATKAGTQAKRRGVYLRDIQAVDKSLQACTSPAATTYSSHSNGDDWSAWLLAVVEKLLLFVFYLLVGGTQLWDGCEWCWRSWRLLCRTCTNFRSFFGLVKQSSNAPSNQTSNIQSSSHGVSSLFIVIVTSWEQWLAS